MLASLNPICLMRDEPRVTSDCEITMDDLQPQTAMIAHGSATRHVAPGIRYCFKDRSFPGFAP
jgi:hypothetical protein